ncbi:MAG: HNH endonuclease [Burkholderiales bacterium]|nr:HNH endonuclease [Burkholderiales bacterium]
MTRRRIAVQPRRPWAPADFALLDARYPHERTDVLAAALGRPVKRVYAMAYLRGLRKSAAYLASPDAHRLDGIKGMRTRFAKGNVPWNQGTHWTAGGRSAETRFKPGNVSKRWDLAAYCVGALRINADGALEMKVREGSRSWISLARWTWERQRGPIPKNMAVRYNNGDTHDCRIENLRLCTRADLMRENTIHNYPKEIVLAVQLVGALHRQINRREGHGTKHREPA